MPADASSPIPPAFDQLREHPGAVPKEIPGLLERLAEVPDPRDPRGVRHALVVVLALTACAVLAGATSLLAVGEWITDTPPSVLERLAYGPIRCPEAVPAGGGDGAAAAGDCYTEGRRRPACSVRALDPPFFVRFSGHHRRSPASGSPER